MNQQGNGHNHFHRLHAGAIRSLIHAVEMQPTKETHMTTLEVKLDLPDRLAREAQAAGLLTPKALREMLRDAMQRRAAQTLLAGAAQGSAAGGRAMSMKDIQAEVNSVRRERRPTDRQMGRKAA